MKKITLVDGFKALERWNRLSVEERFALTNNINRCYDVEIISTNPDETIVMSFCNEGDMGIALIDSELIGMWKVKTVSSGYFACADVDDDDWETPKYIHDAAHFKRFYGIDAKLWK